MGTLRSRCGNVGPVVSSSLIGQVSLRVDDSSVAVDRMTNTHWLVICSCGWTRECSSRWAAESVTKLHPKLDAPGVPHTGPVKEPPAQVIGGPQPPLISPP